MCGRRRIGVAERVDAADAELLHPVRQILRRSGETHVSNSAPFSEHSKVAAGSSAEKVRLALVLLLGETGPATLVSGGIATVQP